MSRPQLDYAHARALVDAAGASWPRCHPINGEPLALATSVDWEMFDPDDEAAPTRQLVTATQRRLRGVFVTASGLLAGGHWNGEDWEWDWYLCGAPVGRLWQVQ